MVASVLTELVLPSCLFIIMLGMGLSLVPGHFLLLIKFPKPVILGLLGQLVLLPVVGFLIAVYFVSDVSIALGIMLLVACPGGATSNLVTHLARGDLALSVTLTAFSSTISVLSIPLIIGYSLVYFSGGEHLSAIDPFETIITLYLVTLFPIVLGMVFRKKWSNLAIEAEKHIRVFASLFLVFLIFGLAYQQRDSLVESIVNSGPAALLLNLSTMLIGLILAKLFQLNGPQRVSIIVEIGMQNSALAILIATTMLNDPKISIPAAVYSLIMYLSGGVIIGWRRKAGATQ